MGIVRKFLLTENARLINADDIKNLRRMSKITQKDLAKRAGLSQSLIARIENKTVDPRLSTIKKIINVLYSTQNKTVKDVMHSPVITIKDTDSIKNAIELMKKNNISQLPVLKGKRIVGSIQESTIIWRIVLSNNPESFFSNRISDIMEKSFVILQPSSNIEEVISILSKGEPAVLVVDKNNLLGIITKIDVIYSTSIEI